MKLHLAFLVGCSLLAGCKKEAAPDAAPVAKPVAAPVVESTPAKPVAAAFDSLAVAQNTLAGFDPKANELAFVVDARGPASAVQLVRFSLAADGEAAAKEKDLGAAVGDAAATAKAYGAVMTTELAGLTPVTGSAFVNGTATLDKDRVQYLAKAGQLRLTSGDSEWTHPVDGGGVATPTPIAAFSLAADNKVAVLVMMTGDEVRAPTLVVFDRLAVADNDPMQKAAEERLAADAECATGNRHDCADKPTRH
jgi:hypothetical protein